MVQRAPENPGVPWKRIHRFEEVVCSDLDVRGHQAADRGVGPTEHDVFGGTLEDIVQDLEGARAVVAQDRLRVTPRRVYLGDMRVDDCGGGTVQQDAASSREVVVPMDVAAVEDQVVRRVGVGGLVAAECDDRVDVLDARGRGELHADEAIVMGTGLREESWIAVGTHEFGHQGGQGRGNATARGG